MRERRTREGEGREDRRGGMEGDEEKEDDREEKEKNTANIHTQSDGVLVVGTSLQVFSIFRFIRAADQKNIPIGILNIGPTRGDDLKALEFKVYLLPSPPSSPLPPPLSSALPPPSSLLT